MLRVERLTRMSVTRRVHAQIGPLILWWRERFARAGGCAARYPQQLVLQKAEIIDPLLQNYCKQLTKLTLELDIAWPYGLQDEEDHLRTHFSQPAIESALRKKLPKFFDKIFLNVSVSHFGR